MKTICALLLALVVTPCHAQICRFPDYTPSKPRGATLTAFESRFDSPAGSETSRNLIYELNAGSKSLPFRVTSYNESLPIRILYKTNSGYDDGPLIFPGSSADIEKGNVYFKYYCGVDNTANCTSIPARAKIARCPDGSSRIAWRFWIVGWHALMINNPVIEQGFAKWVRYAQLAPVGSAYTNVGIVDRDTEATYFIRGSTRPIYLVLDGARIPDPIPQAGRYYTGKKFELVSDSPFPNLGDQVFYQFVSVAEHSDDFFKYEPEDIGN